LKTGSVFRPQYIGKVNWTFENRTTLSGIQMPFEYHTFDFRTQINHLNIRLVRYSDDDCKSLDRFIYFFVIWKVNF
jgi:hypothetical protein